METTKTSNIKIHVNPERTYSGQFIGWEYYKLDVLQKTFPFVDNLADLDPDGFDLGDAANNVDMIRHRVLPYRRRGHLVL